MRTFKMSLIVFAVLIAMVPISARAASGPISLLHREKLTRPFGTDKKVVIAIDTMREIGELRYVNTRDPASGQDRQARIPHGRIFIQLEQGLPVEVRGDRTQEKQPIVIKWRRAFRNERQRTLVLLDGSAKKRIREQLKRENRKLSRDEKLSKWEIEEEVHPSVIEAEIPADKFSPGDLVQITIAQQQFQDPIRVDLQIGNYSVQEYLEYEGAKDNPELLRKLMVKWANQRETRVETPIPMGGEERIVTLPPPSTSANGADLDLEDEARAGNVQTDRRVQVLPPPNQSSGGMGLLKIQFLEQSGQVARTNLPCWLYRWRNGRLEDIQAISIMQGRFSAQVPVGCSYAVKIHPQYYRGWNPPPIVAKIAYQDKNVPVWPIQGGTLTLQYRRNR